MREPTNASGGPTSSPIPTPRLDSLLGRVRARLGWARFGNRWYVAFLVAAALFAVALVVSRGTGWMREWFVPISLIALPVLGALSALAFVRRPSRVDAARAIDRRYETHDLVLTASTLGPNREDFRGHVCASAETRAVEFKPRDVVPWRYRGRLRNATLVGAILVAAVLFMPDFATAEQEDVTTIRRTAIEAVRRANVARADVLAREESKQAAGAIDTELDRMAKELLQMAPGSLDANRRRIAEMRRTVAERWKKLRERRAAERRAWNAREPHFGGDRERREWREALEKGDLSKLKDALEDLRAKAKDPKASPEQRADARRKLEQLADFARREMASESLASALDRARQMLEMTDLPGLNQASSEALDESLELAEAELDNLQETLSSLERLEEAMKALQQAQKTGQPPPGESGDASDAKDAMKALAEAYEKAQREGGG